MIARSLRAQAYVFSGDVVLLWIAAAGFVMALSLAISVPPDLAHATGNVRDSLTGPFAAVLATYGSVLAAAYGSFRYTVDRRDGVVAQRLMLQPRWVLFVTRLPASALGGAIVALAAVVGGHVGLAVTIGGAPVDWPSVGSSLALGAAAGLWGWGVGIVVQAHLLALFVVPMSLGLAVVVGMLWKAGAVYLPLLALLQAFRFEAAAVGIRPQDALDGSVAVLVSIAWVLAALFAGGFAFMRRDVK